MEAPGNSPSQARADTMRRRRLLRDLLRFQAKLLIDALKDLLLSPIAVVTAVIDLMHPQPRPQMRFYRVLALGRRIEARIDLFCVRRGSRQEPDEWTVDEVLEQVESRIVTRTGQTGHREGGEP